jgi:hypothetical protein
LASPRKVRAGEGGKMKRYKGRFCRLDCDELGTFGQVTQYPSLGICDLSVVDGEPDPLKTYHSRGGRRIFLRCPQCLAAPVVENEH